MGVDIMVLTDSDLSPFGFNVAGICFPLFAAAETQISALSTGLETFGVPSSLRRSCKVCHDFCPHVWVGHSQFAFGFIRSDTRI